MTGDVGDGSCCRPATSPSTTAPPTAANTARPHTLTQVDAQDAMELRGLQPSATLQLPPAVAAAAAGSAALHAPQAPAPDSVDATSAEMAQLMAELVRPARPTGLSLEPVQGRGFGPQRLNRPQPVGQALQPEASILPLRGVCRTHAAVVAIVVRPA